MKLAQIKRVFYTALGVSLLASCGSTPENICEKWPNRYKAPYTFLPDEIKPLVRIEPRYPKHAFKDKVEGWVELAYVVVNGRPSQIRVISAKPEGVFDISAITALSKWIYQKTYQDCILVPKAYPMRTVLTFAIKD
ncbi:energy transducer TonB [Catenovulum maritimum]|uniref:energy transducer TonB n=1 Tax=Catenovulum maritimum TaxID=1513271 RepID=UPI00065FC583|nr:energy transducer TonB [Catenovulum maritimum]